MVSGDQLGVNALGFAGFLLVKRPVQLEEVVAEGSAEVLEGVGCESVHQVAGGPGLDGDIWIP
jgi:ATP adenylyltransferase/5',5'''-P-1,P-4-tetraphosphate phosphorylase II